MIFDDSNYLYNRNNIIEIFGINTKLNFYLRDNIDKILKDYSNPDLEKYKPKDGYEFIEKDNYNEGIGIYHSHLGKIEGNLWVLIWYFKENKNNFFEIIFETMIHPTDNYKSILKSIMSDPYTINTNTWKHFLEKLRILNYSKFISK